MTGLTSLPRCRRSIRRRFKSKSQLLKREVEKIAAMPVFDSKQLEGEIAALRSEVDQPAKDPKPLEDKIASLRGEVDKVANVPALDPTLLQGEIAALRHEIDKVAGTPEFDPKSLKNKLAALKVSSTRCPVFRHLILRHIKFR